MKIVIIQPSFLPWRGYFHLIQRSDAFVFYDDVQYDKHSWRNRNIIKTKNGPQWITVPVLLKNRFGQKINEVHIDNISNARWRKKIWHSIYLNYKRAKYFEKFAVFFENIFSQDWDKLCELDIYSTMAICEILGIKCKFYRSSELNVEGERISRIVNTCKKLGGDQYISGPKAKDYITEDSEFVRNGITLEFHQHDYAEYQQLHGNFIPNVSIIDLLFNCGDDSPHYIWGSK